MLRVFWTASKTIRYWCFRFLIQLLIRMKFYIKFHVRLYKILCSLVFFLTSIRFIRYTVTVMVLICFVFPSWISNDFWIQFNSIQFNSIQFNSIQFNSKERNPLISKKLWAIYDWHLQLFYIPHCFWDISVRDNVLKWSQRETKL